MPKNFDSDCMAVILSYMKVQVAQVVARHKCQSHDDQSACAEEERLGTMLSTDKYTGLPALDKKCPNELIMSL